MRLEVMTDIEEIARELVTAKYVDVGLIDGVKLAADCKQRLRDHIEGVAPENEDRELYRFKEEYLG